MQRVPIFGGSGFPGSRLCDQLIGDDLQTRSFCYVDNMIDGFVRMLNRSAEFTGPMNFGNPNEFTMLELAEKVLKLVCFKSKLCLKPLPADDPRQRQSDIALANSKLGWRPTVCLEDGLKETIGYSRSVLAKS